MSRGATLRASGNTGLIRGFLPYISTWDLNREIRPFIVWGRPPWVLRPQSERPLLRPPPSHTPLLPRTWVLRLQFPEAEHVQEEA